MYKRYDSSIKLNRFPYNVNENKNSFFKVCFETCFKEKVNNNRIWCCFMFYFDKLENENKLLLYEGLLHVIILGLLEFNTMEGR